MMLLEPDQSLIVRSKLLHPKYYKRVKEAGQQSYLGRSKMGWFLAD
jgi:hypothetical protein